MKKIFKTLLSGESVSKLTKEEIDILANINVAKKIYDENKHLRYLLEEIADMSHTLMWVKDMNSIYLYANKHHCVHFFKLPSECSDFVVGRSDVDLVNDFVERTGKWNTFGDICLSTDFHCLNRNSTCSYLEMGWIGDDFLTLSVRKAPRYDNQGRVIGIVGLAIDVSYRCQNIIKNIPDEIKSGHLEQLCPGAFWVKKEENPEGCFPTGTVPDFSFVEEV